MPAKIIRTYRENFPAARLVGRRYTNAERANGSFGAKWDEWFAGNLFAPLEAANPLVENGDAYIGAMHVANGAFAYWIGMLLPADAIVPDGYEFVDMEPRTYAVCWLYGNAQNGELYGADVHALCLAQIASEGWTRRENDWCFERYNCPRFTTPDAHGLVILDYGLSIEA